MLHLEDVILEDGVLEYHVVPAESVEVILRSLGPEQDQTAE